MENNIGRRRAISESLKWFAGFQLGCAGQQAIEGMREIYQQHRVNGELSKLRPDLTQIGAASRVLTAQKNGELIDKCVIDWATNIVERERDWNDRLHKEVRRRLGTVDRGRRFIGPIEGALGFGAAKIASYLEQGKA